MIKILHTADLHLDSPLSSNENYPVKKQDLRDVFYNIIELAIREKVDIVLICGDLFDNEAATIATRNLVIEILSKVVNIRFFIISGNHDYYKIGSIYENAIFPPNVTFFKNGSIEKVKIEELNTVVYGLGANINDSSERLLQGFTVEDSSKINLMLFHGNLVSNNTNANYFPLSSQEIEKSGLDYLALGHIHKALIPKKIGNTFYGYSGIPQGRGFDELDEKGVLIGEISKENKKFDFIKTCKKMFSIEEINIEKATNIYDVISLIKEKTIDASVIYRILLVGQISTSLHLELDNIMSGASSRYIEVADNTTILEDVKLLMSDNTLKGLFIKNIMNAPHAEQENKIYETALRIGLEALSK